MMEKMLCPRCHRFYLTGVLICPVDHQRLVQGSAAQRCPKCLQRFGSSAPHCAQPEHGTLEPLAKVCPAGDCGRHPKHIVTCPRHGGPLNVDPLCDLDIDGWRIVDYLGGGAFGVVFLVDKAPLQRLWVMKILTAEAAAGEHAERFDDEARAASGLTSPHIVSVFDVGQTAALGRRYLLMERAQGVTLQQYRLEAGGRLRWWEVAEVALGLCHGLAEAHERGIVHRDLKPENIMVSRSEQGLMARILDFGVALLREHARKTAPEKVLGTPLFMSPEQCLGDRDLDGRSDMYALGFVLYELLTGAHPYDDPTPLVVMQRHLTSAPPELVDEVHGPLRNLVNRMMAKERGDRPTAKEAHSLLVEITRVARAETARHQAWAGWRQEWENEKERLQAQLFAEVEEAKRQAQERAEGLTRREEEAHRQAGELEKLRDSLEATSRDLARQWDKASARHAELDRRESAVKHREHVATGKRWTGPVLFLLVGLGGGLLMGLRMAVDQTPPLDQGVMRLDQGVPPQDQGVPPRDRGVVRVDQGAPPDRGLDQGTPPPDQGVVRLDQGTPPPPDQGTPPPPDQGTPPPDRGVARLDQGAPSPDEVRVCNPWTRQSMRAQRQGDVIELLEVLDTGGEARFAGDKRPAKLEVGQRVLACEAAGRRFSLLEPDGLAQCWRAAVRGAGSTFRSMHIDFADGSRQEIRTVPRVEATNAPLCAP